MINFSIAPSISKNIADLTTSQVVAHMEQSLGVKTLWHSEECPFIGRYLNKQVDISSQADLKLAWDKYQIHPLEVLLHEHIHALQHRRETEYQRANAPLQQCPDFFWVLKKWEETYPHSKVFLGHYEGTKTYRIEWEAFAFSRLLVYHLSKQVQLEGDLLAEIEWLMRELGINPDADLVQCLVDIRLIKKATK